MGEIVQKVCPICNKIFYTEKTNSRKYCKDKCKKKGLIIHIKRRNKGLSKIDIRQPVTAIDVEGFEHLRVAILIQAIKDYKSCQKKLKLKKLDELEKRLTKDKMKDIERFFISSWGKFLCEGNEDRIIKYCRYNEVG